MGNVVRAALSIGTAALFAGCGASQQLPAATSPGGIAPLAFRHHMTFRYTGTEQTFKVPRGVTRIRVVAVGGNGGGSVVAHGGRVSAVIPVTPSETLAIYVGGAGAAGGFNGGGAGGRTGYVSSGYRSSGFGGGGASDVREGGDALADRVVVAGGGGGQGNLDRSTHAGRGGQGGARTGGLGRTGCCEHFQNGGSGGTGGTQYQGGSGGEGPAQPGDGGELGSGGSGGSGCIYPSYCGYYGGGGGGGGGGFYGGGGGGGGAFFGCCGTGGGGGGGGGSSYVESTASDVHLLRGSKQDQLGIVTFDW